jgi:ribosome-binding protein aMBF1 (putative translation factor)
MNPNTKTLEQFIEERYGAIGTPQRDKFEKGYQAFKIGYLIKQARQKQGITQEELAKRCNTTKSYISKIENDMKEAKLSTIQKIIEVGLGGKLELSVNF